VGFLCLHHHDQRRRSDNPGAQYRADFAQRCSRVIGGAPAPVIKEQTKRRRIDYRSRTPKFSSGRLDCCLYYRRARRKICQCVALLLREPDRHRVSNAALYRENFVRMIGVAWKGQ
jgi:hypothetical protein